MTCPGIDSKSGPVRVSFCHGIAPTGFSELRQNSAWLAAAADLPPLVKRQFLLRSSDRRVLFHRKVGTFLLKSSYQRSLSPSRAGSPYLREGPERGKGGHCPQPPEGRHWAEQRSSEPGTKRKTVAIARFTRASRLPLYHVRLIAVRWGSPLIYIGFIGSGADCVHHPRRDIDPICGLHPEVPRLPLLVSCISELRASLLFLVEGGVAMIPAFARTASTIVPWRIYSPRSSSIAPTSSTEPGSSRAAPANGGSSALSSRPELSPPTDRCRQSRATLRCHRARLPGPRRNRMHRGGGQCARQAVIAGDYDD